MVNSPTGGITSRTSPALSSSMAHAEKTPPGKRLIPTRACRRLRWSRSNKNAAHPRHRSRAHGHVLSREVVEHVAEVLGDVEGDSDRVLGERRHLQHPQGGSRRSSQNTLK